MIKIENKRDTRAGEYFDLVIDGVTIYGCQYKSGNKDGKPWEFIATPQRKGQDKEGKDKWYSIVKLDTTAANAALAEYLGIDPEDKPFDDTDPPF